MDFKKYLEKTAVEINKELSSLLDNYINEVREVSPYIDIQAHLNQLIDQFIKACEGGKRLRGCLVKLGYELVTGKTNTAIIKPAAAYEIFQTAILAHDDIIDKSLTRRGRPTIYQELGGDHYAISQTINLGDIGFFLAQKIIGDSNFPDGRKISALRSFNNSMLLTAIGEILDVELPHLKVDAKEEDVLTIALLKTARYTLIGPLKLGAILGGADFKLLGQIDQFGINLGIAFQIQDDILGVFGEEEELGKSVTSDIEEGKNTLLIIYALESASEEEKKFLEEVYGKGEVNSEALEKIREIFKSTGALEKTKQKAVEYINQAKKLIPEITEDLEKAKLLEELADYLVQRNK